MAVKHFTPPGTVVTVTANSAVLYLDTAAINAMGQSSSQYVTVHLLATAVGGTTPSLTAELQWSNDGVNFASVQTTPDTFTAITVNGNTTKNFLTKGAYARLVYTVTGTTPTFTLTASAYVA